jgi:outer membrane protein assembly factor BamB
VGANGDTFANFYFVPDGFTIVPQVTGISQAGAASILTLEGLTAGSITSEASSVFPAGSVISQSLAPGLGVAIGTVVNLIVSSGPQPTGVIIPNVVGMPQTAAQSAITSAGLTVGAINQANSSTVPAGYVISQAPASGTSVAPGTAVNLTVSQGPQGSWTMFHHDPQHTGRSPFVGAQTATVKWTVATGPYLYSSPAIGADGTVYVGIYDNKVLALNGLTGTQKWAFTTVDSVLSSPAIGADGTVYVGSNDGNMYALNEATGTQKWLFATGGMVGFSSPAVGVDGTVYVGSYDKKVYALDGITGTQKWAFTTGSCVYSSPAIGTDGTVYVGSDDGKIYALDGITGAQKWAFTTGSCVDSSPAIGADGTVYVGSYDHNVYALDGATGTQKWVFTTGSLVYGSPTIGADNTVYVGSYDHNVYALDGATGTQKWVLPTVDIVLNSPAIGADGTVYVGCGGSQSYGYLCSYITECGWYDPGRCTERNNCSWFCSGDDQPDLQRYHSSRQRCQPNTGGRDICSFRHHDLPSHIPRAAAYYGPECGGSDAIGSPECHHCSRTCSGWCHPGL